MDNDEYKIICSVIDSISEDYVNKEIEKILNIDMNIYSEIDTIPLYNYGKGLSIWNMTSKFLSIFYLYKLDYYIVHDLKLKYMIIYMDDMLLYVVIISI